MARITDDSTSGQTDHNPLRFEAEPGARIELPSNDFVGDSQILRDGQDLILRTSDGSEIVVENYFLVEPAPMLISSGGAALTPELVDSFAKPLDGVQMAQKGSMDDASPVGMVKEVSGEATVTHANGISEKASIGTPIYQGDIIETKGEGAVNIAFVDDTTFAVSSNARLAIDEYVFDPQTQSGETNFSVMQGVFVFTSGLIGREDPDDVKIETPVGSIGIRGTTIMGTIDPDGESQITVVEGAIVVTNDSGEQTLSQQYETVTINGYDSSIVHEGVLTTQEVSENYNVMRTISAQLFSQIDEGISAKTDDGDAAIETTPDASPEGTEALPDSTIDMSPSESPSEVEEAPESAPAATEETKSETILPESEPITFDNSAEFDLAAGTKTVSYDSFTTSEPVNQLSLTNTYTMSSPTVSTKTFLTPTPTNTTTNTTTTTAGGTTPPPYDLFLNPLTGAASPYFIPGFSGSNFHQGDSVLALGDYNHDGQADFAFTNFMELVLHLPVNPVDLNSTFGLTPGNSHMASYLGDIDGDGIGDLILGSPDEGGGQGLITIMDLSDPTTTNHQIVGAAGTTEFGDSVSGIGDFNGDGYNDMIVGAPAFGGGPSHTYVIYGDSNFYGSGVNLSFMGTNPSDPEGFQITDTINIHLGETVVGLQDFNGDGYSDFATSRPGADSIKIAYGTSSTTMQSTSITGIDAINKIPMFYAGDMNGAGRSDLGIYEEGTDTLHILYGENSFGSTHTLGSITNKLSIVSSTGEIISAGYAGDFNGDGFDDIAVASRNGSIVDVFVVYGRWAAGTLDLAMIDPAKSFHARIDLAGAAFDFDNPSTDPFDISLSTLGDRNNDGYDDLMIGLPNLDRDGTPTHSDDGGIAIIDGRRDASGVSPNVIEANPAAFATGANQTLAGNAANNFMSNDNAAYTNTRYLGGGGDDQFRVFGAAPAELEGGSGYDNVEFMSSGLINLENMGSSLSGVERIIMAGGTSTLRLGIDDIFRLLQESTDGTLTIDGGATTQLVISDNTATDPTTENLTHFGFTSSGNSAGHDIFSFGAYTVYVADTISNVQVA